MYAGKIFDAITLGATPATAVAPPLRMDNAIAMSIHTQVSDPVLSTDLTYTYELSSNSDGPWVAGSVTIADHTSLDITDFSPEASKWIRFTVTNNDAVARTNLTTVLNMQEGT